MLLSPGECWALLSLTVDQLTTGGWLFLQAQRRPAPPWFICVFPMIDTDKRWRQSNNVKVSLIELIGEHILRGWLLALRGYSFLPAVGPCVGIKSSVSLISVSGLIYIVQEGGPQECPRAIYTPPRSSQAGGPKGDVTHRSPALHYSPPGALSPFSVVVPQKHQVWIRHQRGVGIPSIGSGCLYLSGGLGVASAWFWQLSVAG